MSSPNAERRRYNVGARKIPFYQRDIAHSVIAGEDLRGYYDIMGSNSDNAVGMESFAYGADVCYSVELNDDEATLFLTASNVRYVEEALDESQIFLPRAVGQPTGTVTSPGLSTLTYMRARYVDLREWHGRDVTVGLLDDGTSQAMRAALGITLVGRKNFTTFTLPGGQEMWPDAEHAVLTGGNLTPPGGRLLDAIIWGPEYQISDSWCASAVIWCVDNGAKVIVVSVATEPGGSLGSAFTDAVAYARDRNVHFVIACGNDNTNDMSGPANLSRQFSNVHSSTAFDESTDRRALFSNYASDATGCGPGVDVISTGRNGELVRWNGTSASSPNMANLFTRALTGGRFTTTQVASAFRNNTRNTGASTTHQGRGAWDLQRALAALGSVQAQPTQSGVSTSAHVNSRGVASTNGLGGYSVTPASGIQSDDLQIVVVVSSISAPTVILPGFTLLNEASYNGGWEQGAGITVGATSVRVLAAPYQEAQPNPLPLRFGGGTFFSALGIMTLRAPGGIDPERLVPTVKFGIGNTLDAVPVLPATTNDLLVCMFTQRHPDASNGTLSLPSGLTQRGFWRPASGGTTGYTLLMATQQLSSGARTPSFVSTSNDSTGTWASVAFTVPAGVQPIAPVTQIEPPGPPGGATPFLPHA